jgi:hypothetical protein
MRPCVEIAGVIWNEPLGSLLIYGLAALWIWVGWHFWRERAREKSRCWWAWALFLGGAAAASAGTSYQAFSYELKCAGRELCVWTSGWEVAYLALQNASGACSVIAVAWSCTRGVLRRTLVGYAALNAAVHLAITAYGTVTADASLISFELLLGFSLPALVLGFVLNGFRFLRYRTALDAALLGAWIWLVATNAAYYAYLVGGVRQALWRDGAGFYFSENDVLHVGMIGWTLYVRFVVAPRVRDLDEGTPAAA